MSEINSLHIKNITTGYENNVILKNINFSINEGEVMVVIGQNGCGKSTLIKTIARIITDNKGDILFDNNSLNKSQTWDLKKAGISWFVQGGMVFPTMKVSEHFNLALKNNTASEVFTIKEECLNYFPDLNNCMNMRGGNLSGGQRQMLSFAMLYSQQTSCWLLDEPTAGLSPAAVEKILDFLTIMKQKKTILLIEHNYPMAFKLADYVGIIKSGEMQNIFSKEEFQKDNFLNKYLYN